MTALMFLALRATHVLMAGLWIGSTVFVTALLMPALDASGSSGGQVMTRINRHGFSAYMAFLGLTTVFTGLYLLWRFTGGFDPAVAATHAGLAFAVGGAAGVLAGLIGGGVVGRSGKKLERLMGQAVEMTDGPVRGALMQDASKLRQRMKSASRAVIVLQLIALIFMSVGHYV